MADKVIGIDLGTTNSVVAVMEGGISLFSLLEQWKSSSVLLMRTVLGLAWLGFTCAFWVH